ncbi:MAG TPA: hypothetical protein VNU95_01305 [Candidatus Acidoferrales bacterium]|jgi:hypothetical protein|nr:hypothetical protein [Candidatus Acidoferrales bacterium]
MCGGFRILIYAVMVVAAEARAADLNTVVLYEPCPMLPYDNLPGEEPTAFWSLFNVAFDHRAPGVFQDQFNPLNFSNWNSQDGNVSHLTDYNADNVAMARHAFSSAFRSSAQEAALELDLPVLEWLREQPGFPANFLWNSFDRVGERSVSPLDPSYRSDERSWWNEQSESSALRYGLHLFRRDPYAYFGWRIKDRGHVWLLGDARYYYRIFGGQRVELALSTPVVDGLSIEFGTFYDFGMHQGEKKAVLKLLKTFKSGCALQVALEARQQPRLTASITMPW